MIGTLSSGYSLNYVWDTGTLQWVKETQASGGGGVAVTVADGADVTQGAIADAAVTGDTSGTVNAHLRGINKTLSSPLPVINGLSILAYDYVSLAVAATTDTYTFKSGGSGGSTIATVTLTYTDSTKVTLSTVVKT